MLAAVADLRTAVLFPGQGSQAPGMRDLVASARPDLLELVTEAVGDDPFERLDDGTRFQQPAIFAAALAGWEQLDVRPAALAGHSLGEIAALVAAGALDAADGARLVAARGRLMEAASQASAGGMLAVKAGAGDVQSVLEATGMALANDNAPRQVVLSGSASQLAAAERLLAESRTRSMRLPVSGAFHSPLMAPALAGFRAAVAATTFAAPRIPIFSCITAAPLVRPGPTLVAGLISPVRWAETLQSLRGNGVERFVETGPGDVLTGLVRRNLPDAEAVAAVPQEPVRG
jgi:acyl transferase domain-containing protein